VPSLRPLLLAACCLLALPGTPAWAQHVAQHVVDFVIDMRAEQAAGRFNPALHQVGVRGAAAPLSWDTTQVATAVEGQAGLYRLRLVFAAPLGATNPPQPVAHKFKVDDPADPQSGWESGANRSLLLQPTSLVVQRVFGTHPSAPPPLRTGHIERIPLQPSAWVGPREVQVWLPPGYFDAAHVARRYPVLYMHDGQNLFDSSAAGAEWQVDETAQRLVLAGQIQPVIIVAVASTSSRTFDYTPVPYSGPSRTGSVGELTPQGGGAAAYGRYLVDELKPLIDSRYRTLPGRGHTAVGGSSLGGLVTQWLLVEHAPVFGAGLVVSPSVWWGRGDILQRTQQANLGALPPPRVWLCMGTLEGPGMLRGARDLRAVLTAKSWAHSYLEEPGAGHDEAAWALRFDRMLRFLYGTAP
jgi:predicted alpha/beta superfamily hydrolase